VAVEGEQETKRDIKRKTQNRRAENERNRCGDGQHNTGGVKPLDGGVTAVSCSAMKVMEIIVNFH